MTKISLGGFGAVYLTNIYHTPHFPYSALHIFHPINLRFASPATRGFHSPLLSLSSLFAAKENLWDQGNSQYVNEPKFVWSFSSFLWVFAFVFVSDFHLCLYLCLCVGYVRIKALPVRACLSCACLCFCVCISVSARPCLYGEKLAGPRGPLPPEPTLPRVYMEKNVSRVVINCPSQRTEISACACCAWRDLARLGELTRLKPFI